MTRTSVVLIEREPELRAVASRLRSASRIAIDVESNGMHRYRASLCTIQLATSDEVIVVDALAVPLDGLEELLGPRGPKKLVHDVAFDARILSESRVPLGNVLDTSLAARMLGRVASGLGSLLSSELGITVDKALQHHDWTERPLREHHLHYLANDVVHLEALAQKLEAEMAERAAATGESLAEAIAEETLYRLEHAASAKPDPRPPYLRLKGVDRVPADELPILRQLAEVREERARSLDVPPYKVLGPDVLFAIAHAKPRTMADLERVKGATNGSRARSVAHAMLKAVSEGLDHGVIPDEETALLKRPRLSPAVAKARRERETKLMAWRREEAKRRGVDEQVVLPGHCLSDVAELSPLTLASLACIPGIGAFRVERDGAAILRVLGDTAALTETAR